MTPRSLAGVIGVIGSLLLVAAILLGSLESDPMHIGLIGIMMIAISSAVFRFIGFVERACPTQDK